MKADILPLNGKYYGTVIQYGGDRTIEVWDMENYIPSDRQLEYWEMTLEEAKADNMMCDSHYETQESYRIAEAIVKAIRKLP